MWRGCVSQKLVRKRQYKASPVGAAARRARSQAKPKPRLCQEAINKEVAVRISTWIFGRSSACGSDTGSTAIQPTSLPPGRPSHLRKAPLCFKSAERAKYKCGVP